MAYFLTVNYYSSEWIAKLWDSLLLQTEKDWILVIVNNAADDLAIASWIDQVIKQANNSEKIQFISAPTNLGFGRACNLGLDWIYAQNSQALVWLINPDARLSSQSCLTQILQLFQHNNQISILGTIIKSEPDQNNLEKIIFAGGSFNPQTGEILELTEPNREDSARNLRETNWLSGCSLILNLANFSECPGFSEDYFLYYEDFDFCQRYRQAGDQIWLSKQVFVYHQVSAIASKYPIIKVRHQIYGYLLSLKKYALPNVVNQRFWRILLAAIWQFAEYPRRSLGKFQGLYQYVFTSKR